MPAENTNSVLIFAITEIYAQNTALLRLLTKEISERTGETEAMIRKRFHADLKTQKEYFRNLLHEHFGEIKG